MLEEKQTSRIRRWQAVTVTLLVIGYAGYYLWRSNLSVVLPLMISDLAAQGWDANNAKLFLVEQRRPLKNKFGMEAA